VSIGVSTDREGPAAPAIGGFRWIRWQSAWANHTSLGKPHEFDRAPLTHVRWDRACVEGPFRMPVYPTQSFVAAGFRLWPINASIYPVEQVDQSHRVPRITFSTDPRMAVQ